MGDVASYEVVGASEQVVAGLNIRLDMIFLDSAGDCVGAATVVVYDQFGDLSVTSFEPDETGCEGVDSEGSQLMGGYQTVPNFESDEEVTTAASFAFEQLQSPDSNYPCHRMSPVMRLLEP